MLSLLELTLLETLNIQPNYPFNLHQQLPHYALSSLYVALEKLAAQGLCTWQLQATNHGPVRKYYRISKKGHRILQTARLTTKLSYTQELKNLLKRYYWLKQTLARL